MITRLFRTDNEITTELGGNFSMAANQAIADLLDNLLAQDPNVSLRDAQLIIDSALSSHVARRIVMRSRRLGNNQ